jgi:hypothetical protein
MRESQTEQPGQTGQAPARLPRGVVARAGGELMRRVAAYVTLDTYARLKAEAGDTMTVSEVAGAAIVAYLEPRRPRGAGR